MKYKVAILLISIFAFGFIQDQYARRVFPVYSNPVACSENQIFYNMITNRLLLCTGTNVISEIGQSTGLASLNGLTPTIQTFAVGSSGADFAISSSVSTHTFNIPTSSATNRGLLSSADWTIFNNKETSANKNIANGYAGLGGTAKVGLSQITKVIGLADLTDYAAKSGTGTTGIGVTLSSLTVDDCLKWSGATWINSATCGGGGSGDMVLASVQTVTGAKTFNPTKLIVGSVDTIGAVQGSFYQDTDDTKLYWAKDNSTWGEVFVSGLSLVNLTSNVTGILPVANGGTNNAFFTVAGPAATAKTYTFPNSNATILTNTVFTGIPYDLSSQIDAKPAINLKIMHYVAARTITLSASGHQCFAVTAATAQTDFVIAIDGVSKGTLRFAAAGTTCTIVSGASDTITAGERVTITAPGSQDATLADITFTLSASLP